MMNGIILLLLNMIQMEIKLQLQKVNEMLIQMSLQIFLGHSLVALQVAILKQMNLNRLFRA